MQGLVVVRLIVENIWNINVNCVEVTGAQNIGSRSLGQHICQVRRSGRCVMQDMMVVVEL